MTDRRDEALERLDELHDDVNAIGSRAILPNDMLRLIEGLRAVLERHVPEGMWDVNDDGRFVRGVGCGHCPGRAWPCPDYTDVLQAILGPGAEGTQEAEVIFRVTNSEPMPDWQRRAVAEEWDF